jgi:hypothetical protein
MSTTYTDADLQAMTRSDLDGVATGLGLNPADYATKADEITAIEAAQASSTDPAADPAATDPSTTTTDPAADAPSTDIDLTAPADASTGGETALFAGTDIAHVKKADDPAAEHAMLTAESWVVLGPDENVPDWAVGLPAAVVDFTISKEVDKDTGEVLYEYVDPESSIVVRERQNGSLISIPLKSAVKVSITGGRTAVLPFA